MFVQSVGWPQIIFNFLGIALIGPIVEWIFGGRRWMLLFFVPGLIGEFGGYLWAPYGAGSSLPLAGLIGSLFVWLLWQDSGVPWVARLLGATGLLGGLGLAVLRDIHGPPLLAGACLAALLLWRGSDPNRTMRRG